MHMARICLYLRTARRLENMIDSAFNPYVKELGFVKFQEYIIEKFEKNNSSKLGKWHPF